MNTNDDDGDGDDASMMMMMMMVMQNYNCDHPHYHPLKRAIHNAAYMYQYHVLPKPPPQSQYKCNIWTVVTFLAAIILVARPPPI